MRSLFRGRQSYAAPRAAAGSGRVAAFLAAVWAGATVALGFLAAPLAFTALPREVAGGYATMLFSAETRLALAAEVLLLLLLRGSHRSEQEPARGSVWLVLSAMFVTIVAGFALPPAMDAARAGRGAVSFGTLHGVTAGLYGLKALLVLTLAWRLSAT